MAKKKRAAPTRRRSPGTSVTRTPGGGSVVVVREQATRVARAVGRRRASGLAGVSIQKRLQGAFLGGAGVGVVEKYFGAQLPTLPFVGRKGAIALAVYAFKPKSGLLQDVGVAAAAMAGYEFAKDGKISGEDEDY